MNASRICLGLVVPLLVQLVALSLVLTAGRGGHFMGVSPMPFAGLSIACPALFGWLNARGSMRIGILAAASKAFAIVPPALLLVLAALGARA
jgi:hypothetical protein